VYNFGDFGVNWRMILTFTGYVDIDGVGHSGLAAYGMKCLRSLERWDRGFEFHSRHGCLCPIILCLCCSVCR
jgi:hypothetical protein